MIREALLKLAAVHDRGSLSARMRARRFGLFLELIKDMPRPLDVIDVGGTQSFWETMEFSSPDDVRVLLINVGVEAVTRPNFRSVAGDGRSLDGFEDGQFDIAFSNSVIEHVGGPADQARMAKEVMRVGKTYFLQTPNRYFPIEPHFFFPFFQFLPLSVGAFILRHISIGWCGRIRDRKASLEAAGSVRLLTRGELRRMFPGGSIVRERFLGLTKSFIVYGGHLPARPKR